MITFSPLGTWLKQQLETRGSAAMQASAIRHESMVNVVGAGGGVTAAYEQLRNAAENAEEHLLLQNAIRRFYRQAFITRDGELIERSGVELITELTLAGYLPNDSVARAQADSITERAKAYYDVYETLHEDSRYAVPDVYSWSLDVLAAEIESTINSHDQDELFVEFALHYYERLIDSSLLPQEQRVSADELATALYVTIHKVLLKSNEGLIRQQLLSRYGVTPSNTKDYLAYNQKIDSLFAADLLDTLRRVVDRQGAPLRVLRHMMEDEPDLSTMLDRKDSFLDRYEKQVRNEYGRVERRIKKAVIRSVLFLLITKLLIGVAIEIPYDIWAHDGIIWLPLIVNLFFPPLYMMALQLTHRLPGQANTTALVDRIDTTLYGELGQLSRNQLVGAGYSKVASFLYAVSGLSVIGGLVWLLVCLQFSFVHIAIFFVFLSAASFLGFRISRSIRELEIVRSTQNGVTFTRDFLYLPFVVVGQWMNDKYSKINIVATVLDIVIELPLKTVLRLIRQWGAFIDDRKDRI